MIPGALFVYLLVGFSVGSPVRRQDGDGKFGYQYDVKHPGGNSRVHVRAGGEGRRNSHPAEYISDASYVNPHYVDPYYQPNRYGHHPASYNRVPSHGGYIEEKVPVYEERSRYPKLAAYRQAPLHAHEAYGIHPRAQEISQSNIEVEPFYERPAVAVGPVYSSPQFVHQAAVDDSYLDHPPSKIEQISLDPEPAFDVVPSVQRVEPFPSAPVIVEQISDLHEPQLPLETDTPVLIPGPPVDQQVLVDEPEEIPVILQKPLDDKPVLSQVLEDIPPPKVILVEPETPIVQQSSVDVPPPISDVKYIEDDVVAQLPLDPKPSIKTVIGPPVVQQVADYDADLTPVEPLPYSGDILHRSGHPLVETTLDKYPSQNTYDSGDINNHNPAPLYAPPPQYEFVPFGPPYEKISHSTEIIHGPPRNLYPVKLPPPSTKSVAPPLPHQQEHIDVPLSPPVTQSVKLPPPPPSVTKSVLPHAQEYIDVPLTKNPPVLQSVKLPPPPITKSVFPVVSPPVQEPVDVLLPHDPPVPHSVKLPPASVPVYKSPPQYKPVGSIKAPPYARGPGVRYPPVSHSVKQPYARSYYVKSPHVSKPPLSYVPLTKSPVPYSVKRPYASPPVSPYLDLHRGNPHVKSPYVKTPVTKTSPISHGVKHPIVSNAHSVKHPKAVASVKGYPNVKAPPHVAQSSHADEPLPASPPFSSSIKHPHNSAPNLPQYDPPVGSSHLKHPPLSGGPVKKYPPVGHAVETFPEPEYEPDLGIPPEIPYPSEETPPLQKYPPPLSHAFQISPGIPPPELRSESSPSVLDDTFSDAGAAGPSPFNKYPRVSHSVLLPVSKPPETLVPNLFAAVPPPSDDFPLAEKSPVSHAVVLPSPVSQPKVSALRSDALSHPVRSGTRRGRHEEPRQDFPAFPVESAYNYPDPVSDKVAHLSNSFRPRGGYEPDESESSNSPSVGEAKLEIDRVNKEIGFGDRISARSRF